MSLRPLAPNNTQAGDAPAGADSLRSRRLNMTVLARIVVCGLVCCMPVICAGQSVELQHAYQRFAQAREGGDLRAAADAGRAALALLDGGAEHIPGDEIDLLRDLADVLARAGEPAQALALYRRQLALQEAALAPDHPDLVPTLEAMAGVYGQLHDLAGAERMLQRTLDIERAVYGPGHENVVATLGKLRELYAAGGRAADAARIDAEVRKAGAVSRDPLSRASAPKDRRYRQEHGFATVRVFYGTNRAPSGLTKAAEYYGRERGELGQGYLDVSVPETHKEGELETQSRWSISTWFLSDEARKRRFVLLQSVTPLSGGGFVDALRRQVRSAPSRDVFIFVHGFNTSFEDAARRTAQLAYDLDFDGTPMMYAWPSQASTAAYTVDEAAVGISGRKLATFLETVAQQSGAERIHLIAHSMGNRALLEAMQTYLGKRPPEARRRQFGQIVFTAPDVDRDFFVDTLQQLREAADRVTLYASNNDLALRTSQAIHGAPRAGQAGSGIITMTGLDSIDMSEVKADMLGHGYFASDAGAIYDLFRLLWRGEPPPRRCGMVDQAKSGAAVWMFNTAVCKGQEVLLAGVLFKRFGDRARVRARMQMDTIKDPEQKKEWGLILRRLDDLLNNGPAAVTGSLP
jgi:esterase/lipase superfamily enzyme